MCAKIDDANTTVMFPIDQLNFNKQHSQQQATLLRRGLAKNQQLTCQLHGVVQDDGDKLGNTILAEMHGGKLEDKGPWFEAKEELDYGELGNIVTKLQAQDNVVEESKQPQLALHPVQPPLETQHHFKLLPIVHHPTPRLTYAQNQTETLPLRRNLISLIMSMRC